MNPKYPIYIVSKGRWESRLTSKALESMGVPYFIVVEEQEYENYVKQVKNGKVLILPSKYQLHYDTCDALGATKGKGPGAARNFCWDNAIENGFAWHWVMDDNISSFIRLNKNAKIKVATGSIFRCAEDFVGRYENVGLAGLNYDFFAKARQKIPPYITNTRIYSCLLIRNDIPYRWRGRYNEDTDLSLRALKDGYCTVQFNAFLQEKAITQSLAGGNTAEFYQNEGTLPKSKMLEELHSDVTEVVWKFKRWHHQVDYTPFKKNKLVRKDVEIAGGVNNYGMELVKVK
tara:strand:- start:321 stop:1184 length:864 start_codon:yes stop_codon:yes gene_type:complete